MISVLRCQPARRTLDGPLCFTPLGLHMTPHRSHLMTNNSFSSKAIIYLLAILIVGGGWFIKRKLNFALMYENQTESMICKMVKAEYLTDEGLKRCREFTAP